MAPDIKDPRIAQEIINDIEASDIKERRYQEFRAWEVYSGRVKKYVQSRLQEQFPNDYSVMEPSDISISQKVVNKKSKSYKEGVIRSVEGDEKKTQIYNEIAEKGKFSQAMSVFDKYINLHRYGALWVVKREGRPITIDPIPAYSCHPILDQDTGDLIGMVLNYPDATITRSGSFSGEGDSRDQIIAEDNEDSSATARVYAMWTDDAHTVWKVTERKVSDKLKTQVDYVPIDGNPNNINPIGKIPFILVKTEPGVELPNLNPITEQTIMFNTLNSHLLTAASRQGFGMMVIKHPEKKKLKKVHHGLTTAISLPQPPPDQGSVDLSFENPNPDLSGQMETYKSYLQMVLGQHGITSASGLKESEKFSSGLERLISEADVSSHIEEMQQHVYSDVEKDVFDLVKRWLDVSEGRSPFEDNDQISIVYQKPKVLITDKEKIDNIEKLLNMGMISKVDAMMKLNPNLTKEQAQDKLDEIEEKKLEAMERFLSESPIQNQQRGDNQNDGSESRVDERDNQPPKPFGNNNTK